jgi:Secretion system C-terminal sorting domain
MKSFSLHGINAHLFALLCVITVSAFHVRGAEFAIINQTFTYTSNASGFSCNVRPPYPGNVPTNWLSPDNYWDGTFYAYYEVIDIPTSQPFSMQMGVFQYFPSAAEWDNNNYRETCSLIIPTLQGEGDHLEVNYGSPSGWWQHPTGAVDFSRVYDFESVGPVMRSLTPGAYGILYDRDTAAWAVRTNYFPCTIKIIVVAVSSGSTFSGWSNYLGGCTPVTQTTPTYAIDYFHERTDKAVPSTDEYSYSPDMSNAVSGNGSYLYLTPGQDVYFRKKQNGPCNLASDIQHLYVVSRAANPSFTIDYANEQTAENVPVMIEYSMSAAFTSSSMGAGNTIPLTPGQDIYFRTKSTASAFASQIFLLDVPERPAVPYATIDYNAEKTVEVFPSTMAYSTSSSHTNPLGGTGTQIALTPGQDLYLWVKATTSSFASMDYHLDVPDRPSAPSAITIDFDNERTIEVITSGMEYSTSSFFTGSTAGAGNQIALTPGQDLYIRTKPTASSFVSAAFLLNVPARPNVPAVTIDYQKEQTVETIPSMIEYSLSAEMISPVSGTNAVLTLTPGSDLYLRVKATASQFKSLIQTLVVPERPATPSYTIDFSNEMTQENVPSVHEYSTAVDLTSAISGTGSPVGLTPGVPVYFRVKYTAASFASIPFLLTVPLRPEIISEVGDTMEGKFFVAAFDFHTASDGYDLSDIETLNASLEDLGNLTVKVTPVTFGPLSIKIAANALEAGNFTSAMLTSFYKEVVSIPEVLNATGTITVFPTPVRDMLKVEASGKLKLPVQILLIDNNGILVWQNKFSATETVIDMNQYPEGLYILEAIDAQGNVLTCKVIKQ